MKIKIFHTPGHTKGHVIFYVRSDTCDKNFGDNDEPYVMRDQYMMLQNINRCVFTGDMLTIGGCGRWTEGTPYDMMKGLDYLL